ncbi:hypothetical protein BGZ74_006176, partial [Mortierella antarctica]
MAAAVMAQGRADAVVSAALFFGEDTTESSDPVDIFRSPKNHATTAASILVYSAEKTGFQPSAKSAKSLAEKAVPLKNHATVEELEQAIHDTFPEVSHVGKIASKFSRLVPLHEKNESLKNRILSLVVLDKPQGSDTVRLQLASVKIRIAFDQTYTGSKAYNPQQDASVIVEEYQINAAVLTQNAEEMANIVPIV